MGLLHRRVGEEGGYRLVPLRQDTLTIGYRKEFAAHYSVSALRPRVNAFTASNGPFSRSNSGSIQNVMERAAILSRNGKLTLDLPKAVETTSHTVHEGAKAEAGSGGGTLPDRILTSAELAMLEKDNLQRALTATGGKVSGRNGAAVLLGMKPTTVYSRIKSLQMG